MIPVAIINFFIQFQLSTVTIICILLSVNIHSFYQGCGSQSLKCGCGSCSSSKWFESATHWSTDHSRLFFEPLMLLNFEFVADADPAFHSNADPDPRKEFGLCVFHENGELNRAALRTIIFEVFSSFFGLRTRPYPGLASLILSQNRCGPFCLKDSSPSLRHFFM